MTRGTPSARVFTGIGLVPSGKWFCAGPLAGSRWSESRFQASVTVFTVLGGGGYRPVLLERGIMWCVSLVAEPVQWLQVDRAPRRAVRFRSQHHVVEPFDRGVGGTRLKEIIHLRHIFENIVNNFHNTVFHSLFRNTYYLPN